MGPTMAHMMDGAGTAWFGAWSFMFFANETSALVVGILNINPQLEDSLGKSVRKPCTKRLQYDDC